MSLISSDSYAVIQKRDGSHTKVAKLTSKRSILIEKLRFCPDKAFGHKYGLFDVRNGQLEPSNSTDSETNGSNIPIPEECPETQEIGDKRQRLNQDSIEGLKATGATCQEVVHKLVEGNSAFNERTAYAQQKYVRRKRRKHADQILILPTSLRQVSLGYYSKDPEKLGNLRLDVLSQILSLSNVHSGSKVLVVEQCQGLVTAGVLERMGGEGYCIHTHKHDQPQAIPCVHAMNFEERILDAFYPVPLESVTSLQASLSSLEANQTSTDDANERTEKRKHKKERLRIALEMLRDAQIESLIIALKNSDPLPVLKTAIQWIRPASPLLIYSPFVQPLLECYKYLKDSSLALNVQLSDSLYRRHQVLPDRTHPEMVQLVTSGFLLSAITVIPAEK